MSTEITVLSVDLPPPNTTMWTVPPLATGTVTKIVGGATFYGVRNGYVVIGARR